MEEFQQPEVDWDWTPPKYISPPPLPRQEKIKGRKARKRHYKLMNKIREQVIQEYFPAHKKHKVITTNTRYFNNIWQCEYVVCNCGSILEITKRQFEQKHGGEYKITGY